TEGRRLLPRVVRRIICIASPSDGDPTADSGFSLGGWPPSAASAGGFHSETRSVLPRTPESFWAICVLERRRAGAFPSSAPSASGELPLGLTGCSACTRSCAIWAVSGREGRERERRRGDKERGRRARARKERGKKKRRRGVE